MRIAKDDEIKCMANYAAKTNLIENKDVFAEYTFCIENMEWNDNDIYTTQQNQHEQEKVKENECEQNRMKANPS